MTSITSSAGIAEGLQTLQQLFTKSDKNKNDALGKTEFAQAAANIPGLSTGAGTNVDAVFKQLDTNGDGEITKTELSEGIKLAEKVHDALLMAQELTSGSTLLNILSGKSGDDATSNLFSSGSKADSVGGSDAIGELIKQLTARYNSSVLPAESTPETTPIDTAA